MKKSPKLLDVGFTFYSAFVYFQLILIGLSSQALLLKSILVIAVIYLQAPLLWRLLAMIYGPIPKITFLGKKAPVGNLWYQGHKLQEIFETFEFLEKLLRTIPGLYSAWLRLWGAKIGKKVNWTSGCKLVDRPFIHIGDRSLIGNMSYISAHAIKKKDDKYILYVKDVHIKEDVVVAYSVTISPGVILEPKAFIESGAVVYPNGVIEQGKKYERFEELLNDRFNFLFQRN